MTKREFYERFYDNPGVTFDDIRAFISEYDLYDELEILDEDSFDEYVWDEIRNWGWSWRELRDHLNGLEYSEYYLRDYDNDYQPIDESDIPDILRRIEDYMELTETDWEDDTVEQPISRQEINILFL